MSVKDTVTQLLKWVEDLGDFSLPEWEQLPEMDLYMDQVMTYMEKKLKPLNNDNFDKVLTPFMINNYVKSGLIACPTQKRYNKEQIAYLFGICSIKQILSISDISTLFDIDRHKAQTTEKIYQYFQETQNLRLHEVQTEVSSRLKIIEKKYENDVKRGQDEEAEQFMKSGLSLIAFKLAIEAQIKKNIADQIFAAISDKPVEDMVQPESKKIKKAEKKEKKKIRKQLKKESK